MKFVPWKTFASRQKSSGILPPYRWDGSHYLKRKRSEGPVASELAHGTPVLAGLMEQAYNGYPDQTGTTNSMLLLDNEFDILKDGIEKHLPP